MQLSLKSIFYEPYVKKEKKQEKLTQVLHNHIECIRKKTHSGKKIDVKTIGYKT